MSALRIRTAQALMDVKAGFIVFLIALPLCLGIAMASGFPPVAGILTAVIGGVLGSALGGARLTIKGPAAGLIVIALGAVQELGGGDPLLGYKRALATGVVAAAVQIVFALLRFATAGIAMSPSVVHGMLAAIGVIIISKQAHTLLGVIPQSKEPLPLLAELPESITHANPEIALLGLLSLVILFGLPRMRALRGVPAPIVVLAVTIPLAHFLDLGRAHDYTFLSHVYHVGPAYLLQLPGSLLEAIAFPDFSAVLSPASLKYVVMFSLIGTIESTLTVLAVDSMDPRKRASNLNRDLFVLGVGNLVSSLVGGLPMISEIVRSKANVDAGADSGRANFVHGALLLSFVALVPSLLNLIPMAALAAMLIYTGTRLASVREVLHARHIGRDQLLLFLTTLLVTLATDLLIGVLMGMVVKIGLHRLRGASVRSLFFTRVHRRESGEELRLEIHGAAAFPAVLSVRRLLSSIPAGVRRVVIDLEDVLLVDHTFLNRVTAMSAEWRHVDLEFVGVERLVPCSSHPHASRRKVRS